MLEIIGAAIFGIVATGAWMHAENQEQKDRKDSRKNGNKYYFDKKHNMRHSESGKRVTKEDAYQAFFLEGEKKYEQMKKERDDMLIKKYWIVTVYPPVSRISETHVFLNEEDAKKFLRQQPAEDSKRFAYHIENINQHALDVKKIRQKTIYHRRK